MNISRNCPICLSKSIEKKPAILMPFVAKKVFDWEPVTIKKEDKFKTLDIGKSYASCNSVFCKDCTLLFLDMRFDDDEMNNLYKDYRGSSYVNLREKYEPGYSKRNKILSRQIHYVNLIENFISLSCGNDFKTLLDWGGETGINTPYLNNSSVKKYIFDISRNQSNKYNVEYLDTLQNKKFDLITCIHVFEHIPYPLRALKELILNLNDNGFIYIEVPKESIMNEKSLDMNLLSSKKHWHEHVNFFSTKSLTKLVKNAGLDLVDIDAKNVTKDEFSLSIYQLIAKKTKNK